MSARDEKTQTEDGQAAVVLDTNVLVAAGFNRSSASARVLQEIRRGTLCLVWDDETRAESEHILRKIPPLSWENVAELYRPEERYDGATEPEAFSFVPDPDDWAFAALASATGAALLTLDDHLLGKRSRTDVRIMTPEEFLREADLA